jgi:hypothetical protein
MLSFRRGLPLFFESDDSGCTREIRQSRQHGPALNPLRAHVSRHRLLAEDGSTLSGGCCRVALRLTFPSRTRFRFRFRFCFCCPRLEAPRLPSARFRLFSLCGPLCGPNRTCFAPFLFCPSLFWVPFGSACASVPRTRLRRPPRVSRPWFPLTNVSFRLK